MTQNTQWLERTLLYAAGVVILTLLGFGFSNLTGSLSDIKQGQSAQTNHFDQVNQGLDTRIRSVENGQAAVMARLDDTKARLDAWNARYFPAKKEKK